MKKRFVAAILAFVLAFTPIGEVYATEQMDSTELLETVVEDVQELQGDIIEVEDSEVEDSEVEDTEVEETERESEAEDTEVEETEQESEIEDTEVEETEQESEVEDTEVEETEQESEAEETEVVETEQETEVEETEIEEQQEIAEEEMSAEEFEALNDPLYSKYMYGTNLMSEVSSSSEITHNSRFNKYSKIEGIDVSKYQQTINWPLVKKDGIEFAIIRLGYRGMNNGSLQLDPYFTTNIKGAYNAGVSVGVYFFTQAITAAEAKEEAQYVIEQLKPYKNYVSYPVFIDIESLEGSRLDNAGLSAAEKTEICKAFCETIEAAGYTAGVYSGKYYYEAYLNAGELDDYYVWMAHYTNQTSYAGKYDMWQFSSTGSVSGISGNVDLDIAYVPMTPGTPQGLSQTAATVNSVTLSWKPVTNADGYAVYCHDANGKYLRSYRVTEPKTTDDGLAQGTAYKYTVAAYYKNADGAYVYGQKASLYTVYTTPGQVQGLKQTSNTTSSVTIGWTKLSGVSGYRIAIYDEALGKYKLLATSTTNSYTISKLSAGITHKIMVQGYVKLNGTTANMGEYSTPITVHAKPAQTTGLKATDVSSNSVKLSWTKQNNVAGYRVYCYDKAGKLLGSKDTTTNSLTYTGLSVGVTYQYKVCSYILVDNVKAWGDASTAVTVTTRPAQVTNLTQSSVAKDKIVVKWSAVTGATGYRVCLYNESTGKYTFLGSTTKTTYTISKLSAGTEYSVRVAAYVMNNGSMLIGTYSTSLKAATTPAVVIGLKQTSQTTDSITISWTGQKNVTGYRIYCYDLGGTLLEQIDTTNTKYTVKDVAGGYIYKVRSYIKTEHCTSWSAYSNGLKVYTKLAQVTGVYRSSASANKIVIKWTEVAGADGYRVCSYDEATKKYTLIGTTTQCGYSIMKVDANKEYNIRVVAYRMVDGKIVLGTSSASVKATTKPAAVTGLKQTGQTADSITISWNRHKNADSYRIYCYDLDGTLLKQIDTTDTEYTIKDVAGKYVYKVKACKKTDKYTDWSDFSTGLNVCTKPKQVTGLYKSSASANKIVIKWTEVEGADGYRVCSYNEKTKKYTLMGTTTQRGYSIMNADANKEYTIRVVAYTMINGKMVLGTASSTLKATTNKSK